MLSFDNSLVAEIRVGQQRGSGFLIAKDIVLTALHVVLGNSCATVPDAVAAEVRFEGDVRLALKRQSMGIDRHENADVLRNLDIPWLKASLLWPEAGKAFDKAPDLALLKLERPNGTGVAPPVAIYASDPSSNSKSLPGCVSAGFPRHAATQAGTTLIWNCHMLSGELNSIRGRSPPTFDLYDNQKASGSKDGWRGMSGAAVWLDQGSDSQLIGVAYEGPDNTRPDHALRVWPITSIPQDDPDFWRLSGIRNAPAAAVACGAIGLGSKLLDNFFRFDRKQAAEVFRQWLAGDGEGHSPLLGRTGAPTKPAAIVLKGHLIDEPMLCAKLFARILADEAYPDAGDVYQSQITLNCGSRDHSVSIRAGSMLREWAQAYSSDRAVRQGDIASVLRDGLTAQNRSRVIIIEHKENYFEKACADVIKEVLDKLSGWPQPVSGAAYPPVVILSILAGNKSDSSGGLITGIEFDKKLENLNRYLVPLRNALPDIEWLIDIPKLGGADITLSDVDRWVEELARYDAIDIPRGLDLMIRQILGDSASFSVRYVERKLGDLIERQGIY